MQYDTHRGWIAWFARNHVAANLLMAVIVIAGLFGAFSIQKQTFPDFEANAVQITMAYRGAAPAEVEEGVVVKIEEAIADIEGIQEIRSQAREGLGIITVDIATGYPVDRALDEIKLRVDAIPNFPVETEKPVIARQIFERQVLWVTVYGDIDDRSRKALAQQVRDELLRLPGIRKVNLVGDRPFEIGVEVSEANLRKYGLTFDEVAQAVRRASVNLPGGSVKTEGGDILLRTQGQAYTGSEFADIVLRTNADGTRIRVADVATVIDGFTETEDYALFDGQPSLSMNVVAGDDGNDLAISAAVNDYVERKQIELPAGAHVAVWGDSSYYLQGRFDMMYEDMGVGALLVVVCLAMFLRLRLAFWVTLCVPVSFLGALWLLPVGPFATSLNMLSLFGFLLILGIVVDDAIVTGESVYTETKEHGHNIDNVIRGVQKIAVPVTFGVLTTVAAFVPLMLIEGDFQIFLTPIAWVVVLCLVFSLIDSRLILPAHLAKIPPPKPNPGRFARLQMRMSDGLERFAEQRYKPLLDSALKHRGTTLALFFASVIFTVGLFGGGLVKVMFFPDVPSDFVQANLRLADGTSPAVRDQVIERMQRALTEVNEEYKKENPGDDGLIRYVLQFTNGNTGAQTVIELTKSENRVIDANEITKRWRDKVGEIPGAREFRVFASTNARGGRAVDIRLASSNYLELESAAQELTGKLREFTGVYDVISGYDSGSEEVRLNIRPEAQALGLTQADLGRQVRQAFYGEEAQRVQRGKDEVRVMVRYPLSERTSMANLEQMRIRTAEGGEVPFHTVAAADIGSSYSRINRIDRMRSVQVTADIDVAVTTPEEINAAVHDTVLPEILARHPDVTESAGGAATEQANAMSEMMRALAISMLLIYILLAIPLKSYTQPLLIMSVIPFGVVGAVLGHWIVGIHFSMMSLFGIIALAGVVVNDSLVLTDYINQQREEGVPMEQAVVNAGVRRFRAILLVAMTTFVGLVPIVLEKSLQAQLIIPMAVSLGFGSLFATVITLFLIPVLYVMAWRFRNRLRGWFGSRQAVPVSN
jgi:multidrug efflux pump subunit AcrB